MTAETALIQLLAPPDQVLLCRQKSALKYKHILQPNSFSPKCKSVVV